MSDPESGTPQAAPTAAQSLGAMWLYSLLRFGLFFILWGLLWVARVPGLLAAVIALLLSVPLSFVLLRKQRERMARNLEQRVDARRLRRNEFDEKLAGEDPDS
jgi:O-antigen ligase